MTIYCATSEKGGSGKTTLVTNLAVALARRGRRVLIIDLDPQRSVSAWSQRRGLHEEETLVSGVNVLSLERLLEGKSSAQDVDLAQACERALTTWDAVVIDVPGADNLWQRKALLCADVALMPIVADGFDHLTATSSFQLIEEAQRHRAEKEQSEALKALVFFNRTYPRSVAVRDARQLYRDHVSTMDVLEEEFSSLNDYAAAASQGLGVVEWAPTSRAARQVERLVDRLAR